MTCEQPVGIILHHNCALPGAQKFLRAATGPRWRLLAVNGTAGGCGGPPGCRGLVKFV